MKKLILAGILTLGLGLGYAYAENKAAQELEHQIGSANAGAENVGGDMSAMKAAGKCNADVVGKKKTPKKKAAQKPKSKSEEALEHANKLSTGDESARGDMGNMKRCGAN